MNTKNLLSRAGSALLVFAIVAQPALADRIKDLAAVAGVRSNQLAGYGLVVGLNGTGDQTSQTPFTVQSIKNMLTQFGVTVPDGTSLQLKNVAAVTIHADLPPFVKPGQTIDITVSSIGNAKSLRGGSLLMAPLRGADGNVYAIAQGNLIVGGFGASGNDGSSVTVNIPSAGRIPNGATVERTVPSDFHARESILLNLHTPDFTTSHRLATLINETVGEGTAQAMDPVSVSVRAPTDANQRTSFLAYLENLEVDPGQGSAKVIINSRTGTVVIGSHVQVSPAAVSHGSLVVTISEQPLVSQPQAAFSDAGQTVVVPSSQVQITEEDSSMFLFAPGTSLDEIVRTVNRVGAAPGDLVAILEALKQAGALRAELVVI
ncbi:flagellar basal body P-ring protein FlgI [Woeseia oceani]|uniref:Flagellar P-ring protein n=1 Tax=Woeseia oceani TaxID=1548547 RepID=A0A193LF76_9GAMM|nr:flagellar basal body P-ring protein FlgI [Woeseia oceani]ANO51034.1 flagellar biosynthesis protein FlgI [Woeseia oceani]